MKDKTKEQLINELNELRQNYAELASLVDTSKQAGKEFYLFFNLVPDMLCIASAEDGYFKKLNPAWEKTLGFTRDELLSKPLLEFIHPDDCTATMAEVEKQVKGQPTLYFENRYICKDGSYKWLAWVATPAQNNNLLYAAARDITKTKKAEEALKESERIRALFEGLPQALYECNVEGIITMANPAYSKITGYTNDEIIGMYIWDMLEPGPQKDSLPAYLKQLVKEQPRPSPYVAR
ncbi:MAG: PAS domain-containing protein, partial [Candidatus Mariimomonas ferrooxydans]